MKPKFKFMILTIVVIAALTIGQTVSAAGTYRALELGTLGGAYSIAEDVNSLGQVVGYSDTTSEGGHAFLWINGTMTDLTKADVPYLYYAEAINDGGQIAGWCYTGTNTHAAFWQKGIVTDLGVLRSTDYSYAVDINNSGQILAVSSPNMPGSYQLSFVWQKGKVTDLGSLGGQGTTAAAINKLGQVVGKSTTATGYTHAFLWQKGQMIDLGTLGGSSSNALSINDTGQIVGNSSTASGEAHAFLWQDGAMIDLGAPFDATAINNRGQIVGYDPQTVHAFLLDGGIRTELAPLTGAYSFPVAVNNKGLVVGGGVVASGDVQAMLWTK